MNFIDSFALRIENWIARLSLHILQAFMPVRRYVQRTRTYVIWFFLVYAIGLVAPAFLSFGWGTLVASIAVMICGLLWGIATVRVTILGLGVDVGEGLIPESIRKNISFLNVQMPTPEQVEAAAKTDQDIRFFDDTAFGRVFRGIATAGLWIMAPLLIAMSVPVSNNPTAYAATVGTAVFITYTVMADWTITGWATRVLRQSVVILFAYNLIRIVFPGWEYLLLALGALVAYVTLLQNHIPQGSRKVVDAVVYSMVAVMIFTILFPGASSRVTGVLKVNNEYQSADSKLADEVNTARVTKIESLDKEIARIEKSWVDNGGAFSNAEDGKKLSDLRTQRERIKTSPPAPVATPAIAPPTSSGQNQNTTPGSTTVPAPPASTGSITASMATRSITVQLPDQIPDLPPSSRKRDILVLLGVIAALFIGQIFAPIKEAKK